ncbi:SDR family oxidoreductase [Streptomyces sp. NPDC059009]|uniref:SDR family oxidoreductase n=1 Tax=Streptomyces sp. NPDC059009 TaxID=3346694 RepID=UPI0036CDC093
MIVVTGATGNVGRALVTQLTDTGVPVRALTRDPTRAHLPEGAEVARLDHSRPDTYPDLFDGADALFLHRDALGDNGEAFLAAARKSGIRRIVVLSSLIVTEDADDTQRAHPIYVAHEQLENLVRDTGLPWTLLRPGFFATNVLQWAPQITAGDAIRGPFADSTTAPVHEADIAAVAARALLDDGHTGRAYRLTGPEAVTTRDVIATLGRALGRDLTFTEIPREDVTPDLYPHVPPQMLPAILNSMAQSVGNEPEITTTVEAVTGTPARTFQQWAHDHRGDFSA